MCLGQCSFTVSLSDGLSFDAKFCPCKVALRENGRIQNSTMALNIIDVTRK